MNKKYFPVFFLFVSIIFYSCASKPRYDGTATLTGMIVDENNNPIYGFPVSASSGLFVCGSAVTNESGIFVIPNVISGKISFVGKREGYAYLDREENIYQRDKVLCFRVSSANAVLDRVEENLIQGNYDVALGTLKKICAKEGTPLYSVIYEYETYCKNKRKKLARMNK